MGATNYHANLGDFEALFPPEVRELQEPDRLVQQQRGNLMRFVAVHGLWVGRGRVNCSILFPSAMLTSATDFREIQFKVDKAIQPA